MLHKDRKIELWILMWRNESSGSMANPDDSTTFIAFPCFPLWVAGDNTISVLQVKAGGRKWKIASIANWVSHVEFNQSNHTAPRYRNLCSQLQCASKLQVLNKFFPCWAMNFTFYKACPLRTPFWSTELYDDSSSRTKKEIRNSLRLPNFWRFIRFVEKIEIIIWNIILVAN